MAKAPIMGTRSEPEQRLEAMIGGQDLPARIPGHGSFTVTADAAVMIGVFGGILYCYLGSGGCRKQGLYFSRTEPKKPLRCQLISPSEAGNGIPHDGNGPAFEEFAVSISTELASKLDGAILDFGVYNKMERLLWLALPAIKGPACTCRRSNGPSAGKRSPCLDDQGVGLRDL